jgi:type IV pilus assembly protein PilA
MRIAPAFLLMASTAVAQENSSASNAKSAASAPSAPDAPTAALRDALSAACSQSEKAFSKFLTARNANTFAHLTAPARVALMKRFVLLNEPGKASLLPTDSGRPTIRCQTPAGAAELQIGGAEISDNLAFLPVEVREPTDTTGASVIRVQMGLVRETSGWKLLSVGLVLLDLPALAFEWDAAEMESTERAAIDGLKKIGDAVETYRRTYARLPESLANLGRAARDTTVGPNAAGLLEPDLAAGARSGYKFRYVISGASNLGAPAKYEVAATPETYGRTGRRSFFRDINGILHGADRQGAVGSEVDPRVE